VRRQFGASEPAPDDDDLIVVFGGTSSESRAAALRLRRAGLRVLPDPHARFWADPYRWPTRPRQVVDYVEVVVRRDDLDRANAVLAAVEPI
jgi:hypothetical protein